MTQETALGAALKQAVQTLSKRKQTELIAEHIYKKYEVFRRFRPLAIETEKELIADLPQFDPTIISRVLANHCRRPKYLVSVGMGGKRFNLQNRVQGEVSADEQQYALSLPNVAESVEKLKARLAEKKSQKNQTDNQENHHE